MRQDRLEVLKMVAEGKITAEEGESLLQTLDAGDELKHGSAEPPSSKGRHESAVEISNVGHETLKDQDKPSREFRDAATDIKREARRNHHGSHRVCHEEPRAQVGFETGETFDLEIDNQHGDVEVKSWAKNSLQIHYQITTWADDEETAKEIASNIEVRIEPEKDASDRATQASITTNYPEKWKLWRNSGPRAQVDYWLVVPHKMNLELHNRHGSVSVDDLRGTTTVSNRHGDVALGAIEGNLNLDTRHGNVEADLIQGNVCFGGGHGNAKLGKVGGNFEGDHGHGYLELDEVGGDLALAHRHGKAVVHSVGGTVEVSKGHGQIELREVRGTFHIDAHHADTHLDVAAPLAGDCVIKGHHAKVNLVAPENAFASIRASTYRGNITSEFEGNLTKEKRDRQFIVTLGETGANLQISNHHGRIDLRCRETTVAKDSHEVDEPTGQSV